MQNYLIYFSFLGIVLSISNHVLILVNVSLLSEAVRSIFEIINNFLSFILIFWFIVSIKWEEGSGRKFSVVVFLSKIQQDLHILPKTVVFIMLTYGAFLTSTATAARIFHFKDEIYCNNLITTYTPTLIYLVILTASLSIKSID